MWKGMGVVEHKDVDMGWQGNGDKGHEDLAMGMGAAGHEDMGTGWQGMGTAGMGLSEDVGHGQEMGTVGHKAVAMKLARDGAPNTWSGMEMVAWRQALVENQAGGWG